MINVVLRRIAISIPVLFGVTVLIFFVLRALPGDPVALLTQGSQFSPAQIHQLTVELGLNKPLLDQYWKFLWLALHGNFGVSYLTRQPVLTSIAAQAGATIQLTVAAVFFTALFGIVGGVLSAVFRNTWVDSTLRLVSLLGTAMPIFWSGILLLILFSFTLHWFPANGSGTIRQLVLPTLSLAFAGSGLIIRLVRNSMLDIMGNEFVTALRSKGVSESRILIRHILRNALVPAVTILGVQIGALLSGAVVTETVYARQGLGSLLVSAIEAKDYPTVQAMVLIVATVYVVVNIIVDISYAYLDPRVRTTLTR